MVTGISEVFGHHFEIKTLLAEPNIVVEEEHGDGRECGDQTGGYHVEDLMNGQHYQVFRH